MGGRSDRTRGFGAETAQADASALAAALATAGRGRVAAVSVSVPAPSVALSSLLTLREIEPIALWHGPHGSPLAGLGAARLLATSDDTSLSAARQLAARLPPAADCAAVALGGAESVPLRACAGGAFDPRRPGDASAGAWPASIAFVPRYLYRHDAAGSTLAVFKFADEGPGPDELANETRALLARMDAAPRLSPGERAVSGPPEPADRDAWRTSVREALASIDAGEAEKLVLARSARIPLAGGMAASLALSRLEASRSGGTLAAFAFGGRTLIASTPETLVRRKGSRVEADALAGTAARGEEGRLGEKERREHRLVVDAIRSDLARLGIQLDAGAAPEPSPVPGAVHLRTVVRGRLARAIPVFELADALHPTPAVAGTPRQRALDWIARHEPGPRGWYAGPFGWFDLEGDGRFVVLLRCAELCDDVAIAWAGAGIVRGSNPDSEFDETELKLAPMLSALGAPGAQQ